MADWDLSAVVRSCNTTGSATTETRDPIAFLASLPFFENEETPFPNFIETERSYELGDVCKPFLPKSTKPKTSMISICNESSHHQHQQYLQPPKTKSKPTYYSTFVFGESSSINHKQREGVERSIPLKPLMTKPKKRKNQQKKQICHVTAENLSSDMWAWRKYGQKPIKGSPNPRNYYRCSSSKGCTARKQVERSMTDPNTYIITYSGDHSHAPPTNRNSLAGSTRNKVLKITPQEYTNNTENLTPPTPVSETIDEENSTEEKTVEQINKHSHEMQGDDELFDDTDKFFAELRGFDDNNFGGSETLEFDDLDFTRSIPPWSPTGSIATTGVRGG